MFKLNNNPLQQNSIPFYTNIFATVNTTRVNYDDMYYFNVAVSNVVYPSTNIDWRPHAVILVPSDMWQYGTCASSIVHFPVNAPVLFTERNFMPPVIINEILRLDPSGEDVPAKILIAGPVSKGVEDYIRTFGLTTYRITSSEDVFSACAEMADFRLNLVPPTSEEGKNDVMVISGENYAEGIISVFYAAHKGTPIIIVGQNNIPLPIQNFISRNQNKNYYIIGSAFTVSEIVESQIRSMIQGNVSRISGYDPFSISVNFSRYESPVDSFGWKHNKSGGWAFSYSDLSKWYHILSGVLFAHLGKHTPLLLVTANTLPDVVRNYVLSINPDKEMPDMPPYMHAYILGSFYDISHDTQVEIEKIMDMQSKMEH
ncbi:MAG: cell wall-binding repeat-containing protein [Sedimentibacter sp.]|uniref:cell wall-binding repeat-containing protein n=1 Tax=Sedimentibacter sp. TaxID=1960295 RepID=UPI003158A0C1